MIFVFRYCAYQITNTILCRGCGGTRFDPSLFGREKGREANSMSPICGEAIDDYLLEFGSGNASNDESRKRRRVT